MASAAINIAERFSALHEQWRPRVAAEFSGTELRIARIEGNFPWHHHDTYDELFIGWKGTFRIEFRDHSVTVDPGEVFVVPRGVEHRTAADAEAEVLFVAPVGERNTGNVDDQVYSAPMGVKA